MAKVVVVQEQLASLRVERDEALKQLHVDKMALDKKLELQKISLDGAQGEVSLLKQEKLDGLDKAHKKIDLLTSQLVSTIVEEVV